MAFIPDDAEDRFNELSPSAERFYIYLCKHRNHKLQVSFGTIDTCAEKYQWKRATKFAVIKELTTKGWIQSDGYAWKLLIGDFSPVNKSKNLDSQPAIQSKNLDFQSKNLDSESKKSDYQSKNLDSHIRNIPALPESKKPEEEGSVKSEAPTAAANGNGNNLPSRPLSFLATEDALAAAGVNLEIPVIEEKPSEAVKIFTDTFPEVDLTGRQAKDITTAARNLDVWRASCLLWRRNNHRAHNLGALLDRYEKELKRPTSPVMSAQPKTGFLSDAIKR